MVAQTPANPSSVAHPAAGTYPSSAVVIPYFGRWPFWFDFFLASCARNPTFHWLIHTDCGVPVGAPPNVTFVETTFADYKARVRGKLGIPFDPASPYKLCDLKPALGFLHEEELMGFDLWGIGDIDVIYGDLASWFTVERLAHQLIATHERRVSGHLCLFANNSFMRESFMQARNWRDALSQPDHVAFDEKGFSDLFMRHKNWPAWLRRWAYRGNPYMNRARFDESYSTPGSTRRPWIDGSFSFPERWFWRRGHLTTSATGMREFPYLHFMFWKKAWATRDPAGLVGVSADAEAWELSPRGFQTVE